MNWKQLKDFCNSLPENVLDKKVILWREEDAINQINAEQLTEDHYIDPDSAENGCFPESEAMRFITDDEDSYPEGMSTFEKVYDKGTPILWENF